MPVPGKNHKSNRRQMAPLQFYATDMTALNEKIATGLQGRLSSFHAEAFPYGHLQLAEIKSGRMFRIKVMFRFYSEDPAIGMLRAVLF